MITSPAPQIATSVSVIPGYTHGVKTAISLPDELFERVTRRAQELGISRSEFFADAARQYLQSLDKTSLTEQINAALLLVGDEDEYSDVIEYGKRRLAESEW